VNCESATRRVTARRANIRANAGAALYVSGIVRSIRDGIELARQSIRSGRARRKLDELIEVSRSEGQT
jgi:anthranilate phosphoribosyltransferase